MKDTPRTLADRVKRQRPDIVGLTATTLSYPALKQTIHAIKTRCHPPPRIIVGGSHISAMEDYDEIADSVDCIIKGEGEYILPKVLESNGIYEGSPIEELDKLPFPARDLLTPPLSTYRGNEPRFESPETTALWSRGCPHNCVFCSNIIFKGRRPRFRSPQNICDELEELVTAYGVRSIFVYDDELIGASREQSDWLIRVCKEIVNRQLHRRLSFKCQGRCSQFADYDTLYAMKHANFKAVMWGVESGSQKVLNNIHKGTNLETVTRVFRDAKRAGLINWSFIMVGNLGETKEDIEETRKFLQCLKPDLVQVTCVTPIVGSPLYGLAERKGWIEDNNFSHYFTTLAVARTDTLSRSEIQQEQLKFSDQYVRLLHYRAILWRKIGSSFTSLSNFKLLPFRTKKFLGLLKRYGFRRLLR